MYTKIKVELRDITKARREMAGPKPTEVDQFADRGEWPGDWYGEHSNQVDIEEEHYDEKRGNEATVQYIGKYGGKKGGKGFQGHCFVYGGFGSRIRSGVATMARAKGKVSARIVATPRVMTGMANTAKVTARTDTQARVLQRKGRRS